MVKAIFYTLYSNGYGEPEWITNGSTMNLHLLSQTVEIGGNALKFDGVEYVGKGLFKLKGNLFRNRFAFKVALVDIPLMFIGLLNKHKRTIINMIVKVCLNIIGAMIGAVF